MAVEPLHLQCSWHAHFSGRAAADKTRLFGSSATGTGWCTSGTRAGSACSLFLISVISNSVLASVWVIIVLKIFSYFSVIAIFLAIIGQVKQSSCRSLWLPQSLQDPVGPWPLKFPSNFAILSDLRSEALRGEWVLPIDGISLYCQWSSHCVLVCGLNIAAIALYSTK